MSEVAAPLHHWTVTCTTCNDSAEYHCNTCGDILCPRCKEIHEKSNATKHHEIVQYADRLEPSKLQGECQNHPGHNHSFWCEKCAKAVCSECVTTDAHKGHALSKIATKVEEKRKVMQEDFGTYCDLLKQWDKSLQDLEREKHDFENEYDLLDREISEQADAICNQVRRIEELRRKRLQSMKPSQVDVFLDQEKILQEGIKNIKKQANEIEDKLRSDDMDIFLKYTSELHTHITPPNLTSPSLPIVKFGRINEDILEIMLGSLTLEKERGIDKDDNSEQLETAKPSSTDSDRLVTSKQVSNAALSLPVNKTMKLSILPKPTVEYTIQMSNRLNLPNIACTESGQAWVMTADTRLQLMNRQGKVSRTINIFFDMARMTITTQGDLLVTDNSYKCIRSITKEGITHILFTTEWEPNRICCLLNGDILVTFYRNNRVVQYSITGVVVRELDSSLFRNPRSVAQNKINQHIYVCDSSSVLAFDMNGTLQYKYTGSDESEIDPLGVCTDQAGHVLITDCIKHRVHILDQDGRFLQYILNREQGLYHPYNIDVDNCGYIWIGECNHNLYERTHCKLKICKYQK